MYQKCETDTPYIFPRLNVKNYVEGQTKNLEKDSSGNFIILNKTSKEKRKILLQ
jgi:hypothetical protein